MGFTELEGGFELTASVHEASVESWSVRAAAGRRLAAAADVPGIADLLVGLLLDEADTGVCRETADALLERQDVHGLRLVLLALARAEEPSFPEPSVMDWLYGSIVSDPRWMTGQGSAQLTDQLEELLVDPNRAVSAQAHSILDDVRRVGS